MNTKIYHLDLSDEYLPLQKKNESQGRCVIYKNKTRHLDIQEKY